MNAQPNPYAPPTAHVDDVSGATSEMEQIRQEHIKHEASVRSIGVLYYLGAFFLGVAGVLFLVGAFSGAGLGNLGSALIAIYLVMAVLFTAVARGIRRYQPWARTATIVLACIGLLGFPLGTLINAYILYLMLAAKGKRIFESDYPDIVAATPHIKYKTSIIVWIVLAILVLVIAAVVIPALVSR
ncbi:hypothetical protein HNQ60_004482 [Povalibacter uvarum]|uniref:Uncharacterized protein n=1 Tax=Povalibacter uvarum TaxID=732238 RepID=A0A841HUD2_9GAMM|nr:hypothetical protein [Povalibacter uvarum]MBB6095592.1 hypothetical protein [Povalibacter uvarum]